MVQETAAHSRPCYLSGLSVVLHLHGCLHYLEAMVLQAGVELLLRLVLLLLLLL